MEMHPTTHAGVADWIPFVIVFFLGGLYAAGYLRLRAAGRTSIKRRAGSFLIGIVLLGVAFFPDVMAWAHHSIKGHMVQHILVGMIAPIFLVLGAPLTLALAILSTETSRRTTKILKHRFVFALGHPLTAMLLNIGGMYVLYLAPLYVLSLSNPWLHHLIHLHFLLAGYLFSWSIIGPDPVPNRPSIRFRMIVLFFALALHAYLSKSMYANLLPANSPFPASEIQDAAKLMYYWGDFAELLLLIGLFFYWYQKGGFSASAKVSVTIQKSHDV